MARLIVCLTGMPGSGKSTIARGLQPRGYDVVSMGDSVRREAERRGLLPTRANLGRLMLELRQKGGPGAIAELVGPQIRASAADVVLVDGVRSNDEISVLRRLGRVRLLAVHASADTRLGFLRDRGRADDPRTRDHFESRDARELGVGIAQPIALSDRAISNAGITEDELVDAAFEVIRGWARDAGAG